jgi:hypothetical protein
VEEALHDLRGLRRELGRQQEQARVNFPIWWEPELTGLVHAWAAGASWNEVITSSSLDEGDVVRVLRRTVDLLSQVPYCELVSEQLRRNARLALKAINRFPVCEVEDLVATATQAPATERPLAPLSASDKAAGDVDAMAAAPAAAEVGQSQGGNPTGPPPSP